MYAEIQTKSYTILQINWRQWPVIYKSQFVLLLHLSVTTYNLKLMKGYLHSSNGTLHTAISKGLVLICSARGVPMSSGRVHAPLQHILTELPVPREYQLFPFIRNQLFQYNLCTLYLTAETEANSAPPPSPRCCGSRACALLLRLDTISGTFLPLPTAQTLVALEATSVRT